MPDAYLERETLISSADAPLARSAARALDTRRSYRLAQVTNANGESYSPDAYFKRETRLRRGGLAAIPAHEREGQILFAGRAFGAKRRTRSKQRVRQTATSASR